MKNYEDQYQNEIEKINIYNIVRERSHQVKKEKEDQQSQAENRKKMT